MVMGIYTVGPTSVSYFLIYRSHTLSIWTKNVYSWLRKRCTKHNTLNRVSMITCFATWEAEFFFIEMKNYWFLQLSVAICMHFHEARLNSGSSRIHRWYIHMEYTTSNNIYMMHIYIYDFALIEVTLLISMGTKLCIHTRTYIYIYIYIYVIWYPSIWAGSHLLKQNHVPIKR